MTYADLVKEVTAFKATSRPSYRAKMLHDVSGKEEVDRNQYICLAAEGKTILHVGASGRLHRELLLHAAKVHGLDLFPDSPDVTKFDLDQPELPLPTFEGVEMVVCGEILEHLANPGALLKRLRAAYPSQPLLVSVPNAFSKAAAKHIQTGYENVNKDHVAWYSPKTLEWLLNRYGYKVINWAWYNGQPYTAEGILAVAE